MWGPDPKGMDVSFMMKHAHIAALIHVLLHSCDAALALAV